MMSTSGLDPGYFKMEEFGTGYKTRATQSVVYPLAYKFDPMTLKINRVPDSLKD